MRAILLILAIALVPSCARRHDPVAPPVVDTGLSQIATEVSIDLPAFRPGETAKIQVKVTNGGSRATTLCFTSGCMLAFQVQDADGRVVAPGGFACTLDAPTVTLAPGQVWTWDFAWKGEGYDPYSGFYPLPAGVYSLYGGLDAFNFHQLSDPVPVELLPLSR